MSLILTSNRLNENKGTQRGTLGTENPADYKNFFRSPILVEADSEIAVQSVKIDRNGNYEMNDNSYFCHYWGKDPTLLPTEEEYEYLNSFARTISLNAGTYNNNSLPVEMKRAFEAQYSDPRIWKGATTTIHTNASGLPQGLDLKFTAKGSASGVDVNASLVSTPQPVFQLERPDGVVGGSNGYGFTPGTTPTVTKIGTTTTFATTTAVGQLQDRVFGLNQGRLDILTKNMMGNRWCCGLSRPQLQYRENIYDDVYNLDDATNPLSEGNRRIVPADAATIGPLGPFEIYDYAVMLSEDDEILVLQRALDNETGYSVMEELEYWNAGGVTKDRTARMTKAQWSASFDGVRFSGSGDEIGLWGQVAGKTTYVAIIGSQATTAETPGKVFTPIGDTSYALYPMFNLGSGAMTINNYESNYSGVQTEATEYKYPTYTEVGGVRTYTPGSDLFSNESVSSTLLGSTFSRPPGRSLQGPALVARIDGSRMKNLWTVKNGPGGLINITSYDFVGLLASPHLGVDFDHVLTIGVMDVGSQYLTITPAQEFPNMARKLGFPRRSLLFQGSTDGYMSGAGTLNVTFTSTAPSELLNKSCFIRVPNLTHKSYNGAQSSMSKILYQVPQFTNDGRQFGPLYFEPGEKTYVSLHNPSNLLLNDLQVQFVEANERVVDSFTGSTQVVFHIRRRKK